MAGSYSDSAGVQIIRKDVADYISKRDGQPASFEDIFLSAGASDGIKVNLLISIHLKFLLQIKV